MIKFWIGTVEQYEKWVADEVQLDVSVKQHAPIYSPNGKEVMVKGIGDMTLEEVIAYQSINWIQIGRDL